MNQKEEQELVEKGTAILKELAKDTSPEELITESKQRVWQKILTAKNN